MRVVAICDIHGNLPALEAVLEEVRQEDVDHVVVGATWFPGRWCAKRSRVYWLSTFPSDSSTCDQQQL